MNEDPNSVHESVMAEEALTWLDPKSDSVIFDGTLGAGGHSEQILSATDAGKVIGVDRDPEILELARTRLQPFGDRATFVQTTFDQVEEVRQRTGMVVVHGALLDLGVSSLQLDRAERGFAFDHDGPLNMRMDGSAGDTAADLVNRGSREELLHAIGELGDEPRARKVVDAILAERSRSPFLRTGALAELVERQLGRGRSHHHPATRTFQGLRMAVNDELGAIRRALPQLVEWLADGARLVVIAFHGGEDKVVKQSFRSMKEAGLGRPLTKRPIIPSPDEVGRNPRSRSARMRVFMRTMTAM